MLRALSCLQSRLSASEIAAELAIATFTHISWQTCAHAEGLYTSFIELVGTGCDCVRCAAITTTTVVYLYDSYY
jgi:hypothetical protein